MCYPNADWIILLYFVGSNSHNNNSPAGDGQAGDAGEGKSGTILSFCFLPWYTKGHLSTTAGRGFPCWPCAPIHTIYSYWNLPSTATSLQQLAGIFRPDRAPIHTISSYWNLSSMAPSLARIFHPTMHRSIHFKYSFIETSLQRPPLYNLIASLFTTVTSIQ